MARSSTNQFPLNRVESEAEFRRRNADGLAVMFPAFPQFVGAVGGSLYASILGFLRLLISHGWLRSAGPAGHNQELVRRSFLPRVHLTPIYVPSESAEFEVTFTYLNVSSCVGKLFRQFPAGSQTFFAEYLYPA